MKHLHVYLSSPDPLFDFCEQDFKPLSQVHPEIDLVFHHSEDDLIKALPEVEFLDTWFFEQEWYDSAPNLKQVFTPAAGQEYVKTHPNVPVRFGTFHGELMAQTALGLILNFTLRLQEFKQQQQDKLWQRLPLRSIQGQTALILGYGSIGRVCGQLLSRCGMKVIGVKRQPETNLDGAVKIISTAELHHHIGGADHVISFLPGGASTLEFISREQLDKFAKTAYFYNLGRGTTVDEQALIDALQNNRLAGAALDVTASEPLPTASPLWGHPKVVILPHSSAYFEEYRNAHVTEVTDLITAQKQANNRKNTKL